MADYSHLSIRAERRDKKRRKKDKMGMSGRSILTLQEQIGKKAKDAQRKKNARNKERQNDQ